MRAVAILLLLGGGCAITTTAANPTALELQLLGAYEDLDRDLVMAASVRGDPRGAPSFASLRTLALEGRALMRFNEDDVRELKREGCAAESLEGQLVARPCTTAIASSLPRVVDQENRARGAVTAFAAYAIAREQGRTAASPAEITEMRRAYARLLRQSARAGEVFETAPGVFGPLAP